MSINIECEERVMLNEEQYNCVVSDLFINNPYHNFLKIKNVYFDTNNRDLLTNHIVLRVRTTNNMNVELTMKIKGDEGDTEVTDMLNRFQHDAIINKHILPTGQVVNKLHELQISTASLSPVAEMNTKRLEIKKDDYLIVVDCNTYSDIMDFDLEIEAPSKDRALEAIKLFCEKYQIEYRNDYKSKSRRAINAITKNQS